MRRGSRARGAVEQADAPVGALELGRLHDDPSFINVRPAGDPHCSTDAGRVELDQARCVTIK